MTRPRRQSGRYGAIGSALAATRRLLVDARLQVSEQRIDLRVSPAARRRAACSSRRAPAGLSPCVISVRRPSGWIRSRVVLDRRAVPAGAVQRRDTSRRRLSTPGAPSSSGSASDARYDCVLALASDATTLALHRRVVDAAELSALPAIRADLVRLEPGLRRVAGDGVELSLQRRNPPAVVDVLRVDVDLDDPVDRHVQIVDRDRRRSDT